MDRRIYLALGLLTALMLVGFLLFVWRRRDGTSVGMEGWQAGNRGQGSQSPTSSDPRQPGVSRRRGFQTAIFSRSSAGALLIGLWLLLTSFVYVYYNLSLVQFQGRYLFPTLIPVGLLGILGLRQILSRRWVWIAVVLCGLAAVIIVLGGILGGNMDKWGVLIAAGGALVLILRRWLPAGLDGWILAVPLAGLAGLSLYSLFAFIVPYLEP